MLCFLKGTIQYNTQNEKRKEKNQFFVKLLLKKSKNEDIIVKVWKKIPTI